MNNLVETITGLPEIIQILIVGLGTFISEDITVISVSIAYYNSLLKDSVYFIGLFWGILLSDILMYYVGRLISYGNDEIFGFKIGKIKQKAETYKSQSIIFLIFTRFTPGLRMPSLVAAGIVKFNIILFIIAKSISILILFTLIYFFGTSFVSLIDENKEFVFVSIIALILLAIIFYNFPLILTSKTERKLFLASISKYFYYEFWPSFVFYAPMIPIWLWLSFKYRSTSAPAYANPAIKLGGLVLESKNEINKLMDDREDFFLKTKLIHKDTAYEERIKILEYFDYPLILKPDFGQRGKGVFLAETKEQALKYLKSAEYNVIAQKYSRYQNEIGVFLYKDCSDTESIKLFSVTEKKFPYVTGDGLSTIKDLIAKDGRAKFCYGIYKKRLKDKVHLVLKKGEIFHLAFAGNHAQGTEFIDSTDDYIDTPLIKKLGDVLNKIDGLNICRFDIKYESKDFIKEGKGFHIIEINGSGAESTNIYDKKFSYFSAYKVLYNQWELMFKIGKKHQLLSKQRISGIDLLKEFRKYKKIEKHYPQSN
jgi:membrane protein DedA with SNARE-associated domain